MNPTGIFYIPARYHAVLYTGTERTSNMPLINSVVKVYKGANSKLDFVLLNADAKPFQYTGAAILELRVYNTRTKKLVISRRLEKSPDLQSVPGTTMPSVRANNEKRSEYTCQIFVSDTFDLVAGTNYSWCIVAQDAAGNGHYFNTSLSNAVTGEFHILDSAFPQVEQSSVLTPEDFMMSRTYALMDPTIVGEPNFAMQMGWVRYASSAMPGDMQLSTFEGLHTIAIYPNNLNGFIQVQATLEAVPPTALNDDRWFAIPMSNREVNIQCLNENCIIPLNYIGNFMWVRVVYYVMEPEDYGLGAKKGANGSIKRVVFRR